MAYFNRCPDCGANLDPGEACTDCAEKQKKEKTPTHQTEEPIKTTDK